MNDLRAALVECARKIDDYRGRRKINEDNTKATLVEVVLRALGWDTSNADEVEREYRHASRSKPADYALILADRPQHPIAVVEAKALGTNVSDYAIVSQVLSYATDTGAPCAVITNGDEWRIYNAHAAVAGPDRFYRAVRISDSGNRPGEELLRVLLLLSKDQLRAGNVQRLWEAATYDQQVSSVLSKLFDPADPLNKGLLDTLSPLLPTLSRQALEQSVARMRATFEFSPTTPIPAKPAAPAPARATRVAAADGQT
ncbi:hypothetical protein ACFQVC_21615 [Streptomyces monticola]|uniref:Type I restriction enzyme R protein N-terminal domain-containing protein n=1 Tax=Streptomyces monticola TaxID=2666263 RepID=A0ABW2JND8_9ACTN